MRKLLILLVLAGYWITGCTAVPISPVGRQAVESESPKATASVLTPTSTTNAQLNSGVAPLVVTVKPPILPVNPVGGTTADQSTAGWQTFNWTIHGVAVDYPPEWSVTEDSDGARFTSPEGALIELQIMQAENSENAGECDNLINSEGLSLELCGDPASNHYSASFPLEVNGATEMASLWTAEQGALEVYRSMMNTLRLTK